MNEYTEKQIEEKLETLASIQPSKESVDQVNQRVRRIISDAGKEPTAHGFFYYSAASAAVLLIGMSVLYDYNPAVISPKTDFYTQTKPRLTLANLNAVFQSGGDKALDDYFEMTESHRQPRTETITLQEIMKEL